MLDRFRSALQRLEPPPRNDEDVVYRILDDNRRVAVVSPPLYLSWRMTQDLERSTIVGRDLVEDVSVRTTFSIMPEGRDYRPFGTSATHTVLLEPLTQYSQRYDTWEEAERGHQHVLSRVGRDLAEAQADREVARNFAGVAAEVRETLSEPMPDLFQVTRQGEAARVRTPLYRADGSPVVVEIVRSGTGFLLSKIVSSEWPRNTAPSQELLEILGVAPENGALACRVDNARQLGAALLRLGQAILFHSGQLTT